MNLPTCLDTCRAYKPHANVALFGARGRGHMDHMPDGLAVWGPKIR
jgi:hypothetical protein